jgi:metal-responsive CopG/Arc/MetJ family transcriptional regulator
MKRPGPAPKPDKCRLIGAKVPPDLLDAALEVARERGWSRSEVVRRALRALTEQQNSPRREF